MVMTIVIHQAFDKLYPFHRAFTEAVPYCEVKRRFHVAIRTAHLTIRNPAGCVHTVSQKEFPQHSLRGTKDLLARLDIHASLRIGKQVIRMPYFTQIGFRVPRPFDVADLNAPETYPDDN